MKGLEPVKGSMSSSSPSERKWADRWDQLFDVLSAEPRREIVNSLLDAPPDRRLPLPEAAESPNQSMSSGTLAIKLQHHHLPKLADAGYIRWEPDPFCVQRGPHFAEPAFIVEKVFESVDEIPNPLIKNCQIIQNTVGDD